MSVGVFEGRNRFSELIEAAERGESTVVTRRGKPVARVVPYDVAPDYASLTREERIAQRNAVLEAARQLRAQITARNGRAFTHEDLMEARDEGRR